MATARPKPDEALTLHLTRRFRAPRARVFRALTEPSLVIRWWGPRGFTVPDCEMDVRVGGAWRTTMRSPEGTDHIVSGVYREIAPPARLVFTWGWESDGERGHETLVTMDLRQVGEDETELELVHEIFQDQDARDQHGEGWASCLDCLEEALAEGAIQ